MAQRDSNALGRVVDLIERWRSDQHSKRVEERLDDAEWLIAAIETVADQTKQHFFTPSTFGGDECSMCGQDFRNAQHIRSIDR